MQLDQIQDQYLGCLFMFHFASLFFFSFSLLLFFLISFLFESTRALTDLCFVHHSQRGRSRGMLVP